MPPNPHQPRLVGGRASERRVHQHPGPVQYGRREGDRVLPRITGREPTVDETRTKRSPRYAREVVVNMGLCHCLDSDPLYMSNFQEGTEQLWRRDRPLGVAQPTSRAGCGGLNQTNWSTSQLHGQSPVWPGNENPGGTSQEATPHIERADPDARMISGKTSHHNDQA